MLNENQDNNTSRLLLAIEMAILKYGREHNDFIQNPYQWFGKKLNKKSANYLYKWFQPDRTDVKVGFNDVLKILKITQDKILYEVAKEELENVMINNPIPKNQLKLL